MSSTNTISIFSLFLVLLSISSLDIVAAAPPGRHAPPYLAGKLGSHKRALKSWLGMKPAEPTQAYYGDEHGLTAPPLSIAKSKRALPAKLPNGWSFYGCVEESSGERLLQGFGFSSDQTSVAVCSSICGQMGYKFSGTEYGDECYCGNSFSGSGGTIEPEGDCSVPCAGDASQSCGNGWRLSMYSFNGTTSDPTASVTESPTASITAVPTQVVTYTDGNATMVSTFAPNATATGNASLPTQVVTYTDGTATIVSTWAANATATATGNATAFPTEAVTYTDGTATIASSFALNATFTESVTASVTGNVSMTATATASAASSTVTAPVYTDLTDDSEWYSLGCGIDDDLNNRILNEIHYWYQTDLTVDKCLIMCEDAGYVYAGVEWGQECYCGNSLASSVKFAADSECTMPCAGNSSETCGDNFRMDIYELVNAAECDSSATSSIPTGNLVITGKTSSGSAPAYTTKVSPSGLTASTSAILAHPSSASAASPYSASATLASSLSAAAASASSTSPSASSTVSTSDPSATGQVETVSTNIPSSSSNHSVYAHHMVGNTYPYQKSDWAADISKAQAAGIDGFALNMGSDWWQSARVADAYSAAEEAGFSMFLSLDMTSLQCGNAADAATLVALVTAFSHSSAQAKHDGLVMVSTFSGEDCQFGLQSVADGWNSMFKSALALVGTNIFFVPSVFSDPATFAGDAWMDGELNWNSGWPTGDTPLDTSSDEHYMIALGSKEYMPAISPYFFTHFPPSGWNKNWIYRSDDFLYARRWEQVIAMRDQVKFTEILTWNDYGESSYIGPITGALPSGSEVWVDGFDHEALLDVTAYYSTAFKTGAYPAVTEDKVVWWARPHPKDATASADSMSKPTRWEDTDDNVYALVFATSEGVVTLTSGSNSEKYTVQQGLNKIKLAMQPGAVTVTLSRGGQDVVSYDSTGQFSYTLTPATYNYNYFVGSSS